MHTKGKNVLLVMADELSRFGLGCYQNLYQHDELPDYLKVAVQTPNIDRLAKNGIRFERAYTPSPICVPARASIATGRYVHEMHYWSSAEAYDGKFAGWGHRLINSGHEVVSFGKLHYRNQTDPTGFTRQYNPLHIVDGIGWLNALLRQPLCDFTATHTLAEQIGEGISSYTRYDETVTNEAVKWLRYSTQLQQPWVAMVSFVGPHYPLIVPAEFYQLYDPTKLVSHREKSPTHAVLQALHDFFDYDRYFTAETRGIARAAYFGLCSFIDAQVGQLIDTLETTGQLDNTVIVFTSDHGEMLGQKGFWTKSVMYEDSAAVPLIISGPNILPAIRKDVVSLIDIAPTLVNLAQPANDKNAINLSLSTHKTDKENSYCSEHAHSLLTQPSFCRTVLSEYHDGGSITAMFMVRWDNWKFVYYAGKYPSQLFNLEYDPAECHDLCLTNGCAATSSRFSDNEITQICQQGLLRLRTILDPEQVNQQAFADQAERIKELGGREKMLKIPDWNYTPTD